ncbi:MAG: hypothetical protein Q8P18_09925 [Pseudomonadota bacterium]|nr:hypothetical protein [Pseudomonadota bacterium]
MTRAAALPLLASLAATALSGCFVYTDDPKPAPNLAPAIIYADAGCYPDDYYHDFVWYFDADVEDYDGSNDVYEVFVDVYDDWSGEWIDGFDLLPEEGVTWYSAWVGSSTYLDCAYSGYVVDFTAVDIFGATDVVSVYPATW